MRVATTRRLWVTAGVVLRWMRQHVVGMVDVVESGIENDVLVV